MMSTNNQSYTLKAEFSQASYNNIGSCPNTEKIAIFPVRYAIDQANPNDDVLYGPNQIKYNQNYHVDTEFGNPLTTGEKNLGYTINSRSYTLRQLRNGYLYIWDETCQIFDEYEIKGYEFKFIKRWKGDQNDQPNGQYPYLLYSSSSILHVSYSPVKWTDKIRNSFLLNKKYGSSFKTIINFKEYFSQTRLTSNYLSNDVMSFINKYFEFISNQSSFPIPYNPEEFDQLPYIQPLDQINQYVADIIGTDKPTLKQNKDNTKLSSFDFKDTNTPTVPYGKATYKEVISEGYILSKIPSSTAAYLIAIEDPLAIIEDLIINLSSYSDNECDYLETNDYKITIAKQCVNIICSSFIPYIPNEIPFYEYYTYIKHIVDILDKNTSNSIIEEKWMHIQHPYKKSDEWNTIVKEWEESADKNRRDLDFNKVLQFLINIEEKIQKPRYDREADLINWLNILANNSSVVVLGTHKSKKRRRQFIKQRKKEAKNLNIQLKETSLGKEYDHITNLGLDATDDKQIELLSDISLNIYKYLIRTKEGQEYLNKEHSNPQFIGLTLFGYNQEANKAIANFLETALSTQKISLLISDFLKSKSYKDMSDFAKTAFLKMYKNQKIKDAFVSISTAISVTTTSKFINQTQQLSYIFVMVSIEKNSGYIKENPNYKKDMISWAKKINLKNTIKSLRQKINSHRYSTLQVASWKKTIEDLERQIANITIDRKPERLIYIKGEINISIYAEQRAKNIISTTSNTSHTSNDIGIIANGALCAIGFALNIWNLINDLSNEEIKDFKVTTDIINTVSSAAYCYIAFFQLRNVSLFNLSGKLANITQNINKRNFISKLGPISGGIASIFSATSSIEDAQNATDTTEQVWLAVAATAATFEVVIGILEILTVFRVILPLGPTGAIIGISAAIISITAMYISTIYHRSDLQLWLKYCLWGSGHNKIKTEKELKKDKELPNKYGDKRKELQTLYKIICRPTVLMRKIRKSSDSQFSYKGFWLGVYLPTLALQSTAIKASLYFDFASFSNNKDPLCRKEIEIYNGREISTLPKTTPNQNIKNETYLENDNFRFIKIWFPFSQEKDVLNSTMISVVISLIDQNNYATEFVFDSFGVIDDEGSIFENIVTGITKPALTEEILFGKYKKDKSSTDVKTKLSNHTNISKLIEWEQFIY